MKVNPLHSGIGVEKEDKVSRKTQSQEGSDFRRLLDMAVEETGDPAASEATAPDFGNISGVGKTRPGNVFSEKHDLQAERLVSLLERFQETLGALDRTHGYREAADCLRRLNEAVEQGWNRVKGFHESHPLRQWMEELRILTYVESVKWDRGDYLPS